MRFAWSRSGFFLFPLAFAAACGGDVFTAADSDGVDSDGSSDGDDAFGTGGSAASGGTDGSGGGGIIADNCGNNVKTDCEAPEDCTVAVDVCEPCYSPSCSAPFAASLRNTLAQGCLRTWDRRSEAASDKCAPNEDIACGAPCAIQPACPTSTCVEGQCQLITDDTACNGSGGAAGSGGTGGLTSIGGSPGNTGGFTSTGGFGPTGGIGPIQD